MATRLLAGSPVEFRSMPVPRYRPGLFSTARAWERLGEFAISSASWAIVRPEGLPCGRGGCGGSGPEAILQGNSPLVCHYQAHTLTQGVGGGAMLCQLAIKIGGARIRPKKSLGTTASSV